MRSFLAAILVLLLAAPAAQAATTVAIEVGPTAEFGERTTVTGAVKADGLPAPGRPIELLARTHPFDGEYRVIARNHTIADGSFRFTPRLTRNADLRVRADDAQSPRWRAYVNPAFTLDFRARSSQEILVIARYRVPREVRLTRRTLFYVARAGAATGPVVARAELERRRPGRFRATATVELPKRWKGNFRYGGCLPYSPGSGMGDARAHCPRKFRFR
ncbi:MAG TPA: hypothetical protein VFP78_21625 [Solirubrobacteraceae bacterium]|nr:hypothetical protein [Solirubrobacteraceae bacterium]